MKHYLKYNKRHKIKIRKVLNSRFMIKDNYKYHFVSYYNGISYRSWEVSSFPLKCASKIANRNLNFKVMFIGCYVFFYGVCVCVYATKSLQSCPTLCDPIDGSPPGSSVPGILQTRTLEWVVISFFNEGKWKVKVKSLSRVRLFATP